LKILIVADTVVESLLDSGKNNPVRDKIDLILSCGDLPPEYLSSLTFRFNVPLMYILGNHDVRYTTSPPSGCQNIDRRLVLFDGLKIIGFSGSRWYNGGINQYTEKEMKRFIGRMRFTLWQKGAPDLVLTHAPPRHIHDEEDPCHKGFSYYNAFIEKYKPAYFLHGHIHKFFTDDSERITTVSTTRIINCYGFFILEI
jgi:Icc-related predicted phosphoesterase